MENQTIKETYNLGNIVGLLKEKNLEIATDKEGRTVIRGDLVIQVTNKYGVSEIKVRVYQQQLYKSGKESKQFKTFETVMNTYKDIKEYGDDADLIEVIVKVNENNYYVSDKDEVVETTNLITTTDFDRGIFTPIKRIKDKNTPQSSKIGFQGFISKIDKKEDNSLDVEIIGVGYGGKAIKNKLQVGSELSAQFENTYSSNCEATLYYVMIFEIQKIIEQANIGFGEGSDIVVEKITKKSLVVGGTEPNYDGLQADQVTQLLRNRTLEIQEVKDKGRKAAEENATPTDLGEPTGFAVPQFDGVTTDTNPFGIA